MMHYIYICGPAGWGLLFVSHIVMISFTHTVFSLVRHGTRQRVKLQHRVNALVFWGFMGAVLGFLGQTSAIHSAMTAIIPAESISPERIDQGFRESFFPSFWGFGLLVVSVILSTVFRWILRRGPERATGVPGVGVVVCLLLISGILAVPALSLSEPVPAATDILTSRVWIGKGGPDDIVFRLWTNSDGEMSGEAHTIRGGKHRTQSPAVRVIWENPALVLHMNTGVIYEGAVDEASNRIEGKLVFRGETIMDLPLNGIDPGDVAGLLARPSLPPGEPVYTYSVPAETGDGWSCAGPESVGLKTSQLEALVTGVIEGKAGLLHSLLIVREGKLVLEEYFHGYERDDLHRLASVTKSVSSLIAGIAVDSGNIGGVDTPLAGFFPQHKDVLKEEWKNVTLKHLLTMSIGTAWTEEEAERTHGAGDEFFEQLLSRSFAHKPGEKWQYVSANVNLLGGVIKHATGRHADEFAAEYLFKPLGIEKWSWDYGMVDGYRLMDGSLALEPRSMAKLGALVASRGSWEGKQIISPEWIKESTLPHIVPSVAGPEKYGYLWWLFYIPSSTGIQEAVVANGKGSQFIVFFPALDLVVVTTGSNDENGKQFAIGRLLSMHILDGIED